jgi:hypothetical protein
MEKHRFWLAPHAVRELRPRHGRLKCDGSVSSATARCASPHGLAAPASRVSTDHAACSCLWLTVATNSPLKGLSPPIQCPCRAHLRRALHHRQEGSRLRADRRVRRWPIHTPQQLSVERHVGLISAVSVKPAATHLRHRSFEIVLQLKLGALPPPERPLKQMRQSKQRRYNQALTRSDKRSIWPSIRSDLAMPNQDVTMHS